MPSSDNRRVRFDSPLISSLRKISSSSPTLLSPPLSPIFCPLSMIFPLNNQTDEKTTFVPLSLYRNWISGQINKNCTVPNTEVNNQQFSLKKLEIKKLNGFKGQQRSSSMTTRFFHHVLRRNGNKKHHRSQSSYTLWSASKSPPLLPRSATTCLSNTTINTKKGNSSSSFLSTELLDGKPPRENGLNYYGTGFGSFIHFTSRLKEDAGKVFSISRPSAVCQVGAGIGKKAAVLNLADSSHVVPFPPLSTGVKDKSIINNCCSVPTAIRSNAFNLTLPRKWQQNKVPCFVPRVSPPTHPPQLRIPYSHSFPIDFSSIQQKPKKRPMAASKSQKDETDEEFTDEFVPRSYAAKEQAKRHSMPPDENPVQVRRVSLKEFTGLDSLESDLSESAPSLESNQGSNKACSPPPHHPTPMVMTLGNLIDKFSTRRRSATVGNEQQDCKTSGENLYNSFDRALGDISEVILRESATIATDFPQIQGTPPTSTEVIFNDSAMSKDEERTIGSINQLQQRLNTIRNRLNSTMQTVPNSKVYSGSISVDKLATLNDVRLLIAACKRMVKMASSFFNGKTSATHQQSIAECLPEIKNAVDIAEKATSKVEILIRRSHSIFQAQQLTANADQILKALIETVKEVDKCRKNHSAEQQRILVQSSTSLAASLTQFIQLIRTL